jgi:membrane protein required for beta-lactamase induction
VGELTDPRRAEQQRLHDELEQARREGRWLSDDERAHRLSDQQRRSQRRRLLLVLLVISLLLPPLWLLVPVWCGLLWWPQTTRRLLVLGLALGASLAVLVVLALLWLLLR